MATDVKPIRTEADYDAAMEEVAGLWGAMSGTPEGDRLDVLATLIDALRTSSAPAPASPRCSTASGAYRSA
jgi:HTH-type transcriptional regulator/antitoxin HigA